MREPSKVKIGRRFAIAFMILFCLSELILTLRPSRQLWPFFAISVYGSQASLPQRDYFELRAMSEGRETNPVVSGLVRSRIYLCLRWHLIDPGNPEELESRLKRVSGFLAQRAAEEGLDFTGIRLYKVRWELTEGKRSSVDLIGESQWP